MDEGMLNDLLECSVCLERLDTSSKVLPCQHTFCRKCLEDIVVANKELRCPECRVLVDCKIEELPPNVLLMRLLEGMKNAAPKKQQARGHVSSAPVYQQQHHHHHHHQQGHYASPAHLQQQQAQPPAAAVKQQAHHQAHARAVYDYISKEPGDLSFKKGDVIVLRKRIDTYWYHGECGGKQGVFPITYVQIMTPMLSHSPQCKALYDFRMTNDDEEGCLTFNKGEVISVIRRVDENWAEGKLDDRIGIFPLAFVELNSLARSLMKQSTNSQAGPSRVAPPTPTAEDSTPLIPTDHTQNISAAVPPKQGGLPTSDSSSTVSSGSSATTTPNTSSSNTSSSSSTAPSSPASPGALRTVVNNVPSRSLHKSSHQQEKRHSFSAVHSTHHRDPTHRHSAEILSPEETSEHRGHRRAEAQPPPPMPCVGGPPVQLPAYYVALYPYKPQKADELELRKGGMYVVTERCQDGWFKGTSKRTQKCGVFPGNYVTLAKSLPRQAQPPALEPKMSTYTRSSKSASPMSSRQAQSNLQPPELPPRAVSPGTSGGISSSWHGQPEANAAAPLGRSQSAGMGSLTPAPVAAKPSDKTKERKEKSTMNIMRRLTNIAKPKSPPPTSYSMDNPVFEDSSVSGSTAVLHSVHVRSGSCPSQLLQVQPLEGGAGVGVVSSHHRLFATGSSSSQRSKHKERPNIIMANLSYNARNADSSAASGGPSSSPNVNHHRKSNSLDAGGKFKMSVPAERFRCIVPYPPNTDYELELQVNDIIYVHKKRDDGWYKGTLLRTGRTGLFPASFVESVSYG